MRQSKPSADGDESIIETSATAQKSLVAPVDTSTAEGTAMTPDDNMKKCCPCCCTRRCEEGCGWFNIHDHANNKQRTLDVPASFGPTGRGVLMIKFCLMTWTCSSMICKWVLSRDKAKIWLALLTNWSLIFGSLWMIVSFLNSLFPPSQSMDLRVKFSWLLFEVTAHLNMLVAAFYAIGYIFFGEPSTPITRYFSLFGHVLIVLVVWFDGLVLNRIPIRWSHLPIPMFMAASYSLWLVIHQYSDICSYFDPDDDPDTNDDLLYPSAVDFEDKTASSTLLVCLAVFVVVPFIHGLLWSLSFYRFPFSFSRDNQRCLLKEAKESSSEPTVDFTNDDTIPDV